MVRPLRVPGVTAWDGEGITKGGLHKYIYLSNSIGDEIYDPNGLKTEAIFRFLFESAPKTKGHAINVIFGSSYDVTKFVTDVSRHEVKKSLTPMSNSPQGRMVGGEYKGYHFEIIPRKRFYIRRVGEKKGLTFWDAYGFFQSSFVEALEKWFGEDYPELALIYEGKALRSRFNEIDIDFIRKYNAAELRALVDLMSAMIRATREAGLTISTYHGAGSLASSMMTRAGLKERVYKTIGMPRPMLLPAEQGYYGGRIEAMQFGYADQKVYSYDINSAYPAILADLPNLGHGSWDYSDDPDIEPMSLYKVRWKVPNSTIIAPFPYRSRMCRKILFPTEGYGWVWYPELAAALDIHPEWSIDIEGGWSFTPDDPDDKPFDFIPEYYELRKQLVEETKATGKPNGAEKVIKLALNSLYGKQAQRVGYKPPFRSTAYAGYITSGTRAQLFSAGSQAPEKVICFATDGIYSLAPLDLPTPREKVLGAWEKKEHDSMLLAQSGHYILDNGGMKFLWSRGFDKLVGDGQTKAERQASYQEKVRKYEEMLIQAWIDGKTEVYLPCVRFCTLKGALMGTDRWHKRGQWINGYSGKRKGKELKIFPTGTKRTLLETPANYRTKFNPGTMMVQTYPTPNETPDIMADPYRAPGEYDPWVQEDLDGQKSI